jgi:hypothetical protein
MAVIQRHFPNLPGFVESGPFRLRLNKFHGRQEIKLVYKERMVAVIEASELANLEDVVARMALVLTDESYAKLPPDEG